MEETIFLSPQEARQYLEQLTGLTLQRAFKLAGCELFAFGFGERDSEAGTFVVHAICPVKVIQQTGGKQVRIYQGNTPEETFQKEIQPLLGASVQRVALSDKQDLWLDLGDYWTVFITFEDGEESWRFFRSGGDELHLVASDKALELN